ncbi:hypothetical protein HN51_045289 [Arachis hypogaea]|uniref:F-box associated beta-propeller type 3 domain-containing protein n=1 Tax=Arachis hypogaea TaxID=3818 RepID=A0A444XZB9_ARAHY|nr:uncharacterized protein LOC107611595 [Arachis ipaensis]RYQ95025.1 hypothetical protein Ahy_B08g090006 [Arachis hypogaea]
MNDAERDASTVLQLVEACFPKESVQFMEKPNFRRRLLLEPLSSFMLTRSKLIAVWPPELVSVQSIMLNNPTEPTNVDCISRQRHYKIVGLLCLLDNDNYQNMHAISWNPCTTGFTFESPQIRGRAHVVCRSSFGYDHLSDSYKSYGIIRKEGPSGFEYSYRIYTFGKTSSWRRIEDDFPFDLLDHTYGSVTKYFRNWSAGRVVLYFDLSNETHGHCTLPNRDPEYDNKALDSVQIKEYEDTQSWTQLAIIPFYSHLYYTNGGCPLQPLYLSESDVFLEVSPSFGIVLYNLNDCSSIDFPVIDSSSDGTETGHSMAYIYHESLVSPNGLRSNSSNMPLHFIKPKCKSIVS